MSNERHTTVLDYHDSDGDSITIVHDPLDGDGEDLWICVRSDDDRERAVVRIPLATLVATVERAQEAAAATVARFATIAKRERQTFSFTSRSTTAQYEWVATLHHHGEPIGTKVTRTKRELVEWCAELGYAVV